MGKLTAFNFYLFLLLTLLGSVLLAQNQSQDILVLFSSNGLLYTTVDKEYEVPEGWRVLQVSSSRWYIESYTENQKYEIPVELPRGIYELNDNVAIFENGEKYVQTPFGIGKLVKESQAKNVLKSSDKAEALFAVPGGFRIYYVLKENTLEQFFEIRSPIDKAYVVLSTAPEENNVRLMYSKAVAAESAMAEEVTAEGRKIFILGYQEGLKNGVNIRNKVLNITRKDWQKINLQYTYTYNWQPADYVIEINTGEELPAGQVYIYSNVSGKVMPIGLGTMPDVNKQGEIYVSKSWQLYHSWTLNKLTKLGGRVYIVGDLNLKGYGSAKVILNGKSIKDLSITPQNTYKILKSSADYYEIEIPVSGTAKISISFSYSEQ